MFEPHPVITFGKVNLESLVAEVVPPYQDQKRMEDEQKVFKERVAAVRLKHKATGVVILFMSFHNICECDKVREMAIKFCHIMSVVAAKEQNPLVVAGVDFNCTKFPCDVVDIPGYTPANRRIEEMEGVMDHFVFPRSANIDMNCVSVCDVFDDSGIHDYLDIAPYSWQDFSNSLDHDPLLCRLRVVS